jgi:hypothetical protein
VVIGLAPSGLLGCTIVWNAQCTRPWSDIRLCSGATSRLDTLDGTRAPDGPGRAGVGDEVEKRFADFHGSG